MNIVSKFLIGLAITGTTVAGGCYGFLNLKKDDSIEYWEKHNEAGLKKYEDFKRSFPPNSKTELGRKGNQLFLKFSKTFSDGGNGLEEARKFQNGCNGREDKQGNEDLVKELCEAK